MTGGMTIEGASETGKALEKLGAAIEKESPDLLTEIMEFFVGEAQGNAPVDTGYLRDNIGITENNGDRGVVTSGADYSIYLEEGTSKMSPQPYMQPAVATTENEAIKMGDKWLQMIIKKHYK